MKEKLRLTKEQVHNVYDSRFIKVFGMEYVEGKQYMNATRRSVDDLVALKSDEEFKSMLPDAVSCVVILNGAEPKLLLTYEFRYPAGQYLLSVPAGLIDKSDEAEADPIIVTAKRELKEELEVRIPDEKEEAETKYGYKFLGTICPDSGAQGTFAGVCCIEISGYQCKLGDEGITDVIEVTEDELRKMIQAGKINDGFTLGAYALYRQSV